jgi:AraC family transcriptional regulator
MLLDACESRLVDAPLVRVSDPALFGVRNIILTGANTWHHMPGFAGPPSIKAVRHGEVTWEVDGRPRVIRPDTMLLLADGEEYSFTIDSPTPSRTFSPVFRRGLIESASHSASATDEALLDRPDGSAALHFRPRLEARSSRVGRCLSAMAAALDRNAGAETMSWLFEDLAARFVAAAVEERGAPERLSSLRASTRSEIHRRLRHAREAVEDQLERPWILAGIAREACMAPHHFHRCFRQLYGETVRAWLMRRRAERAMALLRTSRLSVTEICLSVGYESLGSFSSAFSRRYGAPPSYFAPSQVSTPPRGAGARRTRRKRPGCVATRGN